MNTRGELICIWSGMVFAGIELVGLVIAGFIPPVSPALGGAEVAAFYGEDTLSIRFGSLLMMTGAGFICPFVAAIAMQMRRIEGGTGPLTAAQIAAGSLGAMVFVVAIVFLDRRRVPPRARRRHDSAVE